MTSQPRHAPSHSHNPPPSGGLILREVSFAYEGGPTVVQAFDGVLKPGALTALIGPNAAGKSTLVRLMLGQLTPAAGDVRLDGERLDRMDPRRRAGRIAYVPQGGSVSFGFTVGEVVAMGRYAAGALAGSRRVDVSRTGGGGDPSVTAALRWCDLDAVAHRPFEHLSGGQQQRVILARAIAQAQAGGRVLLTDEPASHMDLWHIHHTMQLCRALAAKGLAVLVVAHDLNLAARYADEVWLMEAGRLIHAGAWDAVLDPAALGRVYQVHLTNMATAGERPVFRVEPPAILNNGVLDDA